MGCYVGRIAIRICARQATPDDRGRAPAGALIWNGPTFLEKFYRRIRMAAWYLVHRLGQGTCPANAIALPEAKTPVVSLGNRTRSWSRIGLRLATAEIGRRTRRPLASTLCRRIAARTNSARRWLRDHGRGLRRCALVRLCPRACRVNGRCHLLRVV
jgi:hypothetical protein